jgi:hypothetical protein
MTRLGLSAVLLAVSLLAAPGCGSPEATSEAINKTIVSATENVREVAEDTANALGAAADDLGGLVGDTAEEVGKAIDNAGRKQSSAK